MEKKLQRDSSEFLKLAGIFELPERATFLGVCPRTGFFDLATFYLTRGYEEK
jgi:hypothetical protein